MANSNGGEQVPVFVAEIAPKNLRGGLTAMNQVNNCGEQELS